MDDTDQALRQEAAWFARALMADKANDASEVRLRLMGYRPREGLNVYLCPRCWLRDGTRVALRSAPGSTDHDILRCTGCGAEVVLPF